MIVPTISNENEINYYEEAKRQVLNKSLLLSDVWSVPKIMGCYLVFIFLGNRVMQKRNPFHLKFLMLAYNIFQISYNLCMFCQCMKQRVILYYINHMCHPMDPSKNEIWLKDLGIVYLFFLSKQIDLLDTVFLVLRKKVEQISFLHLYHHISMAMLSWAVFKYYFYLGEQLFIVVVLNSITHVVMYLYYVLSLMGTSIQKYLWWKKYVTMLQLAQFMIYIVYMTALLVCGCTQPKSLSILAIFQGTIFFILFSNFYNKRYKRLSPSASKSTAISENKKK